MLRTHKQKYILSAELADTGYNLVDVSYSFEHVCTVMCCSNGESTGAVSSEESQNSVAGEGCTSATLFSNDSYLPNTFACVFFV